MNTHARGGGFTLVEVALVGSLVSVLSILVVTALSDLAKSQAFVQGQSHLAEVGDRIIRGIERDVTYSTRVFDDGAISDSWIARMDFPAKAPIADSRMPTRTGYGYFDVDPPGVLETGNMLMLGRVQQPILAEILVGTTTKQVRIDVHNLVLYYVRQDAAGALDLARWGSRPLAAYDDIVSVGDPVERAAVLRQLFREGVRYAWNPSMPAADGLFRILEVGELGRMTTEQRVAADPVQCQTSVLGGRHIRIAANGSVGARRVPGYAAAAPTGFPGGLEFKIDGVTTGKLVLIRMVLQSGSVGPRANWTEVVRVVSCRDG